jgi:hypothetical protein
MMKIESPNLSFKTLVTENLRVLFDLRGLIKEFHHFIFKIYSSKNFDAK